MFGTYNKGAAAGIPGPATQPVASATSARARAKPRVRAVSWFRCHTSAAIALGALAGGLVADGVGVTAVTVTGAALVAGALVTTAAGRAPVPEAPAVPGRT